MKFSGLLHKMESLAENPVRYTVSDGKSRIDLTQCLGKTIKLNYSGKIICTHCGKRTKKSYAQGYCFPCSIKLAECDMCIMKPETCHYDLGTCREPSWGEQHCMQPHVVYLANSSGPKVGITRKSQVPHRWIDQGADQALPILEVPTRKISGLIEVILKQYVSDKTDWRKMLKGRPDKIDLYQLRDEILAKAKPELIHFNYRTIDEKVVEFDYPVLQYPEKVSSLNLEKVSHIESKLLGIKGQYLILETGVLNVRSHTGHEVTIEVHDAS